MAVWFFSEVQRKYILLDAPAGGGTPSAAQVYTGISPPAPPGAQLIRSASGEVCLPNPQSAALSWLNATVNATPQAGLD